jgi:hypothetical protein
MLPIIPIVIEKAEVNERELHDLAKTLHSFIEQRKFDNRTHLLSIESVIHSYLKQTEQLDVLNINFSIDEIYEILFTSEVLYFFAKITLNVYTEEIYTGKTTDFKESVLVSGLKKIDQLISVMEFLDEFTDEENSILKYRRDIFNIMQITGVHYLYLVNECDKKFNDIFTKGNTTEKSLRKKPTKKSLELALELYDAQSDALMHTISCSDCCLAMNSLHPSKLSEGCEESLETNLMDYQKHFFSHSSFKRVLREALKKANSLGGRSTHSRKEELIKIAEDTWDIHPKVPISKLAESISAHDKEKNRENPSLSTITKWLAQSDKNPKISGRPEKIQFELVIK